MTPFNALSNLMGKRVVTVERVFRADQGVHITFDDGTVMTVRYSGSEGEILINNAVVEDAGVFDANTCTMTYVDFQGARRACTVTEGCGVNRCPYKVPG